ncbi:SDR family NAD(P)-dependent oxidoreductase [Streptomyces sp. So13.3]|uniref:SDR family NAD(P)-dependent oxidoreductase n=1 Tax=Streptomyces TaxID=1883 RepID=UPI001105CDE3|nr:SDR family NAD(P)-dependent oxidoreductase [Streptomyces sp. So13.3]QNA76311.1 SDR family NAD(P)-dependent oxidoreductase [Streptomyces sp. So13.3]
MTTTLITGANKGLGFETARQLVAAGHTVYAAARNPDNAQRAAKELGAAPLVLDVTDDASVQAAAAHLSAEHGVLDVLVNNAGINGGGQKPLGECTGADMATVLDTNVVGLVRVLHAFLPLLQRSTNGVVVNVGSGLGSFARVHDPERAESRVPNLLAYPTSKAAVSMLTVQYARAFPQLRINVVDPGPTATDLNKFQGFQSVEQGAAPIVQAALLTPAGPTGTFFDAEGVSPW